LHSPHLSATSPSSSHGDAVCSCRGYDACVDLASTATPTRHGQPLRFLSSGHSRATRSLPPLGHTRGRRIQEELLRGVIGVPVSIDMSRWEPPPPRSHRCRTPRHLRCHQRCSTSTNTGAQRTPERRQSDRQAGCTIFWEHASTPPEGWRGVASRADTPLQASRASLVIVRTYRAVHRRTAVKVLPGSRRTRSRSGPTDRDSIFVVEPVVDAPARNE
jgi:hypothetical protein